GRWAFGMVGPFVLRGRSPLIFGAAVPTTSPAEGARSGRSAGEGGAIAPSSPPSRRAPRPAKRSEPQNHREPREDTRRREEERRREGEAFSVFVFSVSSVTLWLELSLAGLSGFDDPRRNVRMTGRRAYEMTSDLICWEALDPTDESMARARQLYESTQPADE